MGSFSQCTCLESLAIRRRTIMKLGIISLFLAASFLSSLNCRNSAIGMIKRIGNNARHYPKGFVVPAKWIRTLFGLKKHSIIPRYLYFELIMSLIFAALCPINILICIVTDWYTVPGILLMIHCCLIIVNLLFFAIMTLIVEKK